MIGAEKISHMIYMTKYIITFWKRFAIQANKVKDTEDTLITLICQKILEANNKII